MSASGTVPRVAVVGAGAVGGYYGGMLARAGVPVVLIGRPAHVEAMRRDGLRLTTAAFDEHIAVEASTDLAAVAGAALVLVCVKSTDTESTGADLAPHLASDARVLSLQNGVDNAPRLQALLGRTVAPAVVYVASEMAGPGHVRHLGRGELVIPSDIGDIASTVLAESQDIAANAAAALNATLAPVAVEDAGLTAADIVALFARAGVPVEQSDNVVGALWGKLLLNCGYNAISAITDMPVRPHGDPAGHRADRARRGRGMPGGGRRARRSRSPATSGPPSIASPRRCRARCPPPARTCAAASPPRSTTSTASSCARASAWASRRRSIGRCGRW